MADTVSPLEFLKDNAEGDLVPWRCQIEATRRFGISCAEAEGLILRAGLLPKRYERNRSMISVAQQERLFQSRVAVVGCGGLGGYVLEELARIGVGSLVAIDPDVFEEHNLNRQLLSSLSLLGTNKAAAAAKRIAEINPVVEIQALEESFSRDRARALVVGAGVVVDALDSVPARLALAAGCAELGVPLVSGTIGGWFGYVTTVFPGERTLERLYGHVAAARGIEADLGNPSFTPGVVASLEVAETIKVLLGTGTSLREKILCVNLLDMRIESVEIAGRPAGA
jgi:molybdopterin/thiamine biosynthesis adenylyltransferase